MRIVRLTALIAGMSVICLAFTAPAFAGGKATAGCATGGWQLARYVTEAGVPSGTVVGDLVNVSDGSIQQRNHDGFTSNPPAFDGPTVLAIFQSVDNNGDGLICWKLPSGWDTVPPANKAYFLSIGDNKS